MELTLYDTRMLALMEQMKQSEGMYYKEFLESIGFTDYDNINYVRSGKRSFTLAQVAKCIEVYKINPAYFFERRAKQNTGVTKLRKIAK